MNITYTKIKDSYYNVSIKQSLNPTMFKHQSEMLKTYGADVRMGSIRMCAWDLERYLKHEENIDLNCDYLAEIRKERQSWLDNAKAVKEYLTPEQWDTVKHFHLKQKRSMLDYSECGTGKTPTSIGSVLVENPKAPLLIITLKTCKHQWESELRKLGYTEPIVVLKPGQFEIPKEGAIITNWDSLPPLREEAKDKRPLEDYIQFRKPSGLYVIADEVNRVQNPKASVTKRWRSLLKWVFSKQGKVIGLTATPVENKEKELSNILTSLGLFGQSFGNAAFFNQVFGGYTSNKFGRMILEFDSTKRDKKEIQKRMSFAGKRREHTVKRDRVFETITVDISSISKKLDDYDSNGSDEEILNQAISFFNNPKMRIAVSKAKAAEAKDLIDDLEKAGPLLVASCTRETVEAIGSRKGWRWIHGEVSDKERSKIREDFNSGKLKGLAFTVGVGGTGLNLPGGCNMVLLDLHYNEGKNKQALGRIDRHDSEHKTLYYWHIVANHPFDIRLQEILRRKMELAQDITS